MDDEHKKDERFPSNSLYTKPVEKKIEEAKKTVAPVVKGKAQKKKKSLGEKFSETFLAVDFHSVVEHVVWDVLIPAAKDTISDIVKGSINMMLFGDRKGDRTDRDRGKSVVRTSYQNYYDRGDSRRGRDSGDRDRLPQRPSNRNLIDDIMFDTRGDAEEVLSNLVHDIEEYGFVTVARFYSYAGLDSNYTQDKYGWANIRDAYILRAPDGWTIKMPRPIVVD